METFIKVVAVWTSIDATIAFFMLLHCPDDDRAKYGGALVQNLILAIWGWSILL